MDVKEQRVKVFLLWRSKRSEQPAPQRVSRALLDRFAPLFDRSPTPFHRSFSGANLAGFEIPLDGWNADLEQEDRDRWVMSIDPPINARAALGRVGLSCQPSDVLLTLAEALENDPRPLVGELAPPTSLLWENRRTGELRLQTDGLGHAQLFEYDDDDFTVITNRVHALSCLGIDLKPVAEEWAARFTIGWFPLSTTGFRGVQTVRGGTQLCFGKKGVTRDVHSVLNDWVHPEPMSREDALELGTASLETMCDEAMAQWTRPSVGLSGGYDSRAIVSILRSRGADLDLRVRGHPERLDVLIANHLAKIGDLPLRIKPHGGMPPETLEDIRSCISRALLWQGGAIHLKKHLTFRVRGGFERGGVNVMGSHAGIGKADYPVQIGASELDEAEWEQTLLAQFTEQRPFSLRTDLHDSTRSMILNAMREGERYDLQGLHRLHFLFLHEYTRRWAAGAINGAVDLVFTPFLNPDFIRAAYAFPPEDLPQKPFHLHVIEKHAPDWADVPYDSQITREDKHLFEPVQLSKSKQKFVESGTERWRPGEGGHRIFHRKFFWRDVGKPLMNEARDAKGSFCHDVFDKEILRPNYKRSPDAIAVSHLIPGVIDGTTLTPTTPSEPKTREATPAAAPSGELSPEWRAVVDPSEGEITSTAKEATERSDPTS